MKLLTDEFKTSNKSIQKEINQYRKKSSSIGIRTINYVKSTTIKDSLVEGSIKCNQSSNSWLGIERNSQK